MSALSKSLFEFLGIPERFEVDSSRIGEAFRRVQAAVHPDRFAVAGATERRVAMQLATRANEAYRTLSDPLSRARYLCELRGLPIDAESNTAMPADFLVEQMQWREALEEARDARDAAAIDALQGQIDASRESGLRALARIFDDAADGDAATEVRRLMFVERFAEELRDARQALDL